MAKRRDSATFEIVVVLAIVAIVAVTGQVLIYYETVGRTGGAESSSGPLISGFAVAGDSEESSADYYDVGVVRVEVDPASPLVGDPFEVKVLVKNSGKAAIETPFYVQVEFAPKTEESEVALRPMYLQGIMTKQLPPGDEAYLSFLVTTIVPEGPMRITATADSTGKIDDANTGNNQLSKTVIIAVE